MATQTPALEIRDLPLTEPMELHEKTGATAMARQIFARLRELPVGGGVECKVPEGIRGGGLACAITQISNYEDFSVSTRFRNGHVRVWRIEKKQPRGFDLKRAEEIAERRFNGETLDAIASDLLMTRERVRQIAKHYKTFREVSRDGGRCKALDDFAAPFIAATSKQPKCVLCGQGQIGKFSIVCTACRKAMKPIRTAASRIRSYLRNADRHQLSEAIVLIKRHNLTPEDLKRG